MKLVSTKIKDLYVVEPNVFEDERGYFFENYNIIKFRELGLIYDFVQDNTSCSCYGTIRGLHFQEKEHAQAKLVWVSQGIILDVVVDLREGSDTFGQYFSVELSENNKKMLMIPRGFAHGFSALSEKVVFHYKCDNLWCKNAENGIRFDDPDLDIDWRIPQKDVICSSKDKMLESFKQFSKQ